MEEVQRVWRQIVPIAANQQMKPQIYTNQTMTNPHKIISWNI